MYNHRRETYINDKEVMNEYFFKHPDLEIFQECGPEFQELTRELLDDRLATDQFAIEYHAMISEMRESSVINSETGESSSSSAINLSVFRSINHAKKHSKPENIDENIQNLTAAVNSLSQVNV
ncbi:hypothetical protein BDBG_17044 [Blastomyces gilchristii SLH14081]|uniref:Uncharacterized protein n=1 Tax=Blastomyces gilchristii (strain SLH14081) TaxID=559298 RepID=A0A179UKE9_BLAGS|nr:uncharacterized protein BDBG_17044 [Blastomyces gilchristii SLH14081]OAT08444.1 hypothetical protein BDBG_17044 [Blastomyces gilchristii SLH14081]